MSSKPTAADQQPAETRHVETFFNSYASGFDSIYGHTEERNALQRYVDKTLRASMFERFQAVLENTANPDIKTVIDIGCGPGRYVVELAKQGKEIVALDVAEDMLVLARSVVEEMGFQDQVEYVHEAYQTYQAPQSFDAAVLIGFFDYIEDAAAVLDKLGREIDGECYMSFPKKGGFLAWQRKVRYGWRGCPLYYYSRGDVERLLERTGSAGRYELRDLGRDWFVKLRMA